MSHEFCDWMNRLGMIFGFLSFWFAAPEFIGEQRLMSWDTALSAILGALPRHTFVYQVIRALCALAVFGGATYFTLVWLPDLKPDWLFHMINFICLAFTFVFTSDDLATPILRYIVARLARRGTERRRLLLIGAMLFTISFTLQFLATFPRP